MSMQFLTGRQANLLRNGLDQLTLRIVKDKRSRSKLQELLEVAELKVMIEEADSIGLLPRMDEPRRDDFVAGDNFAGGTPEG